MKSRKVNVWMFFATVYGVSALLFAPILLSGKGMASPLNSALMAMVTFVPSSMGVLFIYLTRNRDQRRDFWQRVFRWPRGHTKFALLGMLILPLDVFLAFGISSWLNGMPFDLNIALRVFADWKYLFLFLFVELTFGAISEELGWRGYALDELQSRRGAVSSSLILGCVWAFWHTPAFLIPGTSQYAMGGIFSWKYAGFIVSVILGTFIHTWAYNHTGRSILVAGILMHFTQNAALIFLSGLFEQFTMPPAFWTVQLFITAIVSSTLVLINKPQKLSSEPSQSPFLL